jgi:hypothetical protein
VKSTQKLGNPVFIGSVLILVLNDWFLKQTFSNTLTGKLSDFAGLFALPFFLGALFPKNAVKMYIVTAMLFIAWKSAFIQPFIDFANGIGLPIHRTVDYTDLIALIILPFSFYLFNKSRSYFLKPVFLNIIMVFSALAFMATEMPPGAYRKFESIDKTYTFNFSKRELITRVNALQVEYVHDFDRYGNGKVDFDSKGQYFYYRNKKDTVAILLDYEKVNDTDTIKLTRYANVSISGNNESSALKLLSLYQFVPKSYKGDPKEKSIKFFDKYVIRRIKNYK